MTRSQPVDLTHQVRRLEKAPMYEAILERLHEYAKDAGLRRGARLPSERDLAEQLGTSRASVKQALVALEVQGLVQTRHGGGTFLLRDELSTESVRTLLERQARLPFVMEARVGLECQLAELAALRRTDADLKLLDEALVVMALELEGDDNGANGDRLFHSGVAQAARNPLLERFLDEIAEEIDETRTESLKQPGRPLQSLHQHQAIVDAIRRENAAGARRAMRQHLRSVAKVRLLNWTYPGTEDD